MNILADRSANHTLTRTRTCTRTLTVAALMQAHTSSVSARSSRSADCVRRVLICSAQVTPTARSPSHGRRGRRWRRWRREILDLSHAVYSNLAFLHAPCGSCNLCPSKKMAVPAGREWETGHHYLTLQFGCAIASARL